MSWNGGNGTFDLNFVKKTHREVTETKDRLKIQNLELNGYLENYLWINYEPLSSPIFEHTFSIITIINEKFREGASSILGSLCKTDKREEKFRHLIKNVIDFFYSYVDDWNIRATCITFVINLLKGFEIESVRKNIIKYFSLSIWKHLNPSRLREELEIHPALTKHWQYLQSLEISSGTLEDSAFTAAATSVAGKKGRETKKRKLVVKPAAAATSTEASNITDPRESDWAYHLINQFLDGIEMPRSDEVDGTQLVAMERTVELLCDLLSQLPSRRFLNTLLDDLHVVLRCRRSFLYHSTAGRLFARLVEMLAVSTNFEVSDQTGKPLSASDLVAQLSTRIQKLQTVAFTEPFQPQLRDLTFSSMGTLSKRSVMQKHLLLLNSSQLIQLAQQLDFINLRDLDRIKEVLRYKGQDDSESIEKSTVDFSLSVLLNKLCSPSSQLDALNRLSLYPDEVLLWDPDSVPSSQAYSGSRSCAIPKLNMQFLTLYDYLLRTFTLYRLESAYEIREDLVDAIKRMGPRQGLSQSNTKGSITFGGWARMALPIASINIEEVVEPHIGEVVPAQVKCNVEIDLSRFPPGPIRAEWEAIREHDVVFLVCIDKPSKEVGSALADYEGERQMLSQGRRPRSQRDFQWMEESLDFPQRYGVKYVRGGEIFEVRDEDDVVLNDPTRPDERTGRRGTKRRLRLRLDPAQYYSDVKDGINCYESLNLLVRRKPEENNFKAVLGTIRDMLNSPQLSSGGALPNWLREIVLGYGNPAAASFRSLRNSGDIESLNYGDTFLDASHLKASFPGATIKLAAGSSSPPFHLTWTKNEGNKENIEAVSLPLPSPGPYPQDIPPVNRVRFTPTQVEAIRCGTNPGLTMVVGPPGTGKTDVAVQIIATLYRNYPNQKILLVTHSNAALNDLFEKIMQRNVDPRHLLRLGSGETELRESLASGGAGGSGIGQGEQFSKQGRVNWSLSRRLQLLGQVQRLGVTLGVPGDVGYTCETAEYFYQQHIKTKIQQFEDASVVTPPQPIENIFPFSSYFSDTPKPLFTGQYKLDLEAAQGGLRHLERLFEELRDYRAFEVLRSQSLRSDYLLTKQARIVAMTCTHAALTRRRLIELNFKYDSLVMEEAAQVLEVETLIPLLLQAPEPLGCSRLKRVVLIGDHLQLPPVVKHAAFQKYSSLDQSLFARFIRLGVPAVVLDQQGRARPEIAALYSWRYANFGGKTDNKGLGNLDVLSSDLSFSTANTGLAHTFQLIDVPAFQGKGESAPTPFFYQNLGEAEYIVATFQFMRLMGYPAEKISILTTYNGQKSLIRDILAQRCRSSIFGQPARVTTVDKYQGQQNDYILLSLVRTESVGHVRDVRRLVVALSRARLGLYVFCRKQLFEGCFEISSAWQLLLKRPTKLQLVIGEEYPCNRLSTEPVEPNKLHIVEDVTAMGVLVYQIVQQAAIITASSITPKATQLEPSATVEVADNNGNDLKMT